jgi:hypothetical protein
MLTIGYRCSQEKRRVTATGVSEAAVRGYSVPDRCGITWARCSQVLMADTRARLNAGQDFTGSFFGAVPHSPAGAQSS